MKEKDFEENNLVEELIFDEDGNEIEKEKVIYDKNGNEVAKITISDEVEELTNEEIEETLGGATLSQTIYRNIYLKYGGSSKTYYRNKFSIS